MNAAFDSVKVEVKNRIATVTLNRPQVRNAMHAEMIREIKTAFQQLSARDDLSMILLRGEGKSFSAGADLGYMKSMAGFSFEDNRQDAQELFDMYWALRMCPHPIVGRVHGHAMGGAVGLAALCDITAAVDGAQFCFSEVRLGLAPAVISSYVMEKMIAAHARRYMISGEIFAAHEALAAGLVQFVGDEAQVDEFIAHMEKTFRANGPEAVRATKSLIRQIAETGDWQKRKEIASTRIAELRASAEGQEGLRSFLEKRPPKWKQDLGN